MESIASKLKAQRENLNISLSQIAEDTHISLRYLQSLEAGRFDELPGGMYNRAFLRAYCDTLGLDQKELLQCYESEILSLSDKPVKSKSTIPSSIKISPLIIWSLMLVISAISIFLNRHWIFPVFSPYFSASSAKQRVDIPPKPTESASVSADSSPDFPTVTENLLPLSNQTPTSTPLPEATTTAAPTVNPEPTPAPAAPTVAHKFQLEVTGQEKCWISINRDGAVVFSRVIKPGEVQSFTADQKLIIVVGNAGGVNVKINGKAIKPLGKSGEVIKLLINETTLPELLDTSAG
jgi:cytoskeleton protein RodZ